MLSPEFCPEFCRRAFSQFTAERLREVVNTLRWDETGRFRTRPASSPSARGRSLAEPVRRNAYQYDGNTL